MMNLGYIQRLRTLETLSAVALAMNTQKAQDFIEDFREQPSLPPDVLAMLLGGGKPK
jgi:hypothetical protein